MCDIGCNAAFNFSQPAWHRTGCKVKFKFNKQHGTEQVALMKSTSANLQGTEPAAKLNNDSPVKFCRNL